MGMREFVVQKRRSGHPADGVSLDGIVTRDTGKPQVLFCN